MGVSDWSKCLHLFFWASHLEVVYHSYISVGKQFINDRIHSYRAVFLHGRWITSHEPHIYCALGTHLLWEWWVTRWGCGTQLGCRTLISPSTLILKPACSHVTPPWIIHNESFLAQLPASRSVLLKLMGLWGRPDETWAPLRHGCPLRPCTVHQTLGRVTEKDQRQHPLRGSRPSPSVSTEMAQTAPYWLEVCINATPTELLRDSIIKE